MTNETRSPHEQAPEDPLMQQQATPATELVVEPEAAATEPAAAPEPAAKEMADLPSDHPLLRRAQEALRRQLSDQKLRLQEELRERRKALKVCRHLSAKCMFRDVCVLQSACFTSEQSSL